MTKPSGVSEVWQARIDRELAAELRADAAALGLSGRAETVRAALRLLHQRAAEERMAQSVVEFHDGRTPPLPVGVRRAPVGSATEADGARGDSGAAP